MDEAPPPPPVNLNNISPLMKTEVIEHPVLPVPTPVSATEPSVAPPSATTTPMVTVPIAPAQPLLTSTPSAPIKKPKRGFRSLLNSRKPIRSSAKPATLLARPSIISTSTILPHPQQPILLGNQIAPIIPKAAPTIQTNTPPGFTTYLVVDGNQGQLVQVANDGPKPVTFRNQTGQILQATPITVIPSANQPVVSTFPVNSDCSLLSNSSQTITTVRTSSSIDMQQQTTLTSDTTTLTTQQLTGIIHQPPILPTTFINGNNLSTYDNNSSLDESKTSDTSNLSLSLTQIAQKVNNRHRRLSSSSLSKKKRGRPRLYERDPFTNKPIKSDVASPNTELTIPTVANTTLLVPGQTNTFNAIPTHTNGCSSLIFPNQSTPIQMPAPSLLQQHQYTYPSLLNGTSSATTVLSPTTFNNFKTNSTPPLSSTTYPYSSQSIAKEYHPPPSSAPLVAPTQNLQSSSSSSTATNNNNLSSIVPLESSPRKSSNNDIAVHYIGGYVIRESSQPFLPLDHSNHKENHDQLRCVSCQKLDSSHRFFDHEKRYCSKLCSMKSNEIKAPIIVEPTRIFENVIPQQTIEADNDDAISLPPDHGLPADPSKWTVAQVGEFVARLTNETIREAFYESEMDGQALLLMTQDHLRETMKIKLGPSLIISSEINKLRERAKTFSS
ncbi:unnamed protein product [Adineta ricciae]|uniref:SAM domain-containing protein n=1 Tax=Adineta ricciae TaxID=249248 RepID=A0A816CQR0_ADIRI|nr:unnamed protein product [Adineta ricciae]